MANHIRYIRRRENGVYQYERRVPQTVVDRPTDWYLQFGGAKLFRKSLGTRNQSEALRAGEAAHLEFEARIKCALGSISVRQQIADNATRPVTPAILKKLSIEASDQVVTPWSQRIILAELGGVHAEELEDATQRRDFEASDVSRILRDRYPSTDPRMPDIEARANSVIDEMRLDAPEDSAARAFVIRAVRDGMLEGHQRVDDILSGKRAALPERPRQRSSIVPKLSEIVSDYIATKSSQRTINEVRGALASFTAVIGDLPLDEISRQEFLDFCRVEGARTIGGKTVGSVMRPISPDSLKKKVALLRSAINKSIATGRYADVNPATGIDTKQFTKTVPMALMPAKRPFDVHEIRLILQHPWFTGCLSAKQTHAAGQHRLGGMYYWAPILALHTGCRAGELGGLRLAEIRMDHEHPHLLIQDNVYRTTKGSYRRKVPLLDVLLEHGFGEFVDAQVRAGHDRLFPDWKAPAGKVDASATAWSNGSVIRAFNRTVVRQQLGSILTPGARQEVTFHGFRGAFKTLLGRDEYSLRSNYVHEVVGHAKFALDKRYVGEIPLEDTYPAVRRCRYQGLVLPPKP